MEWYADCGSDTVTDFDRHMALSRRLRAALSDKEGERA